MGNATSPSGQTISIDSTSLRFGGQPVFPRMGEVQFSRVPAEEWLDTLSAARAGGLSTIGTYVFWIHHEEQQGVWRWDGQRDLRSFVQQASSLNLTVVIRAGPWAHGECRNGGFPDWLQHMPGIQLRSLQPLYMQYVTNLYQQIAAQLKGLYWSDGGPVIGMQVENEYGGSYEYLAALKQTAISAGVNIPFFTKTGWPAEPQPAGLLLPLSGGYADGFWDHSLEPVASYSSVFLFHAPSFPGYPPLTVELGGGMTVSYHRRIRMHPADMGALALVAAGSGQNMLGYYIYRGGTNPEGVLSTLEESQITKYPNDLQVKNYDFYAPLGQYGNLHGHYHLMRRLHLFLDTYQAVLAPLGVSLPLVTPQDTSDLVTLRWSARSDGNRGVVFVNNYQRSPNMSDTTSVLPDMANVVLTLFPATGEPLTIPHASSAPITIPSGLATIWPFAFPIAPALTLAYTTCQPVTSLLHYGGTANSVVVLASMLPNQACEIAVQMDAGVSLLACDHANCSCTAGLCLVRSIQANATPAAATVFRAGDGGSVSFVVLSEAASLGVWKTELNGEPTIVLTAPNRSDDGLLLDAISSFRLRTTADAASVALLPAPPAVTVDGTLMFGKAFGLFTNYIFNVPANGQTWVTATATLLQPATVPAPVPLGPSGVAQAPNEDGRWGNASRWDAAAVYRITLTVTGSRPEAVRNLLRIRFVGDCARIYLNGTLVQDGFYNGDGLVMGLDRYAPLVFSAELRLLLLPLRKDAPIYLSGWPAFSQESYVELQGIDVLQTADVSIVST